MPFALVTGEKASHLQRVPAAQVVVSPAALAGYEAPFLYDGFDGRPFRYGSMGADATITGDTNIVLTGDMETADGTNPPLNWKETLSGALSDVTRTTTAGEFDTGTAGMELHADNVGGASAFGYQDVYGRAGEVLVFKARGKTGTAANRKARIQNLETLKYWNGSSWVSSVADAATWNSTGSFVDIFGAGGLAVTLESLAVSRKDRPLIRVGFLNDVQNSDAWVDNVSVHPGTNYAGIHRHNIPPGITVEWRESSDNFSGSDVLVGTFTVVLPDFALYRASTNLRYQRIKFVGTPLAESIWVGELLFSQAVELQRPPAFGPEVTLGERQLRQELSNGDVRVFSLAELEARQITLPWRFTSLTNYKQWRDEILRRSRYGAKPIALLPYTVADPDLVLLGRLADPSAAYRIDEDPDVRDVDDLTIVEGGSPVWLTSI